METPSLVSGNQISSAPARGQLDVEFFVIVIAGMYLHLSQLSIIDLKYSQLPGIQPNPASVLFVFSVLCVLAKSRPYWPQCLRSPPRAIRFCIELFLTLYAMDRILRQVWIPLMKLVNFLCHFLGDYLIVLKTSLLANQMVAIAQWLRNGAFYYVRYLISLSVFFFMAQVTGFMEYCREVKTKIIAKSAKSHVTFADSATAIRRKPSTVSARRSETGSINIPTPQSRQSKKPRRSSMPKRYRARQYAAFPSYDIYG